MLNQLIENTLKNTKLKRVRVKSDPSIPPVFGYENVSHFEGYILEECGTTVSVYIINAPPSLDPLQTVNISSIEEIPQKPEIGSNEIPYETLKLMLLKALLKAGFDENTPIYGQIKNTNNPEFVKAFLDQAGIKPEDLSCFTEADATATVAPAPQDTNNSQKQKDQVFGKPISKTNKILKGVSKGLKLASGALTKGSELLFDRDKNIIGRLTRFLKTLDVNDLVNLKNLKLKSRDYPEMPYQDSPVYIYGLPTLQYFRQEEQKYQIKGKVSAINYSSEGVKFVVGALEPSIKDLKQVLLDFDVLDNPTKQGKIIFIFKDGKERFSKGQIFLGPNGWEAKVLKYGIPDTASESKKGIAFILLSNNLLSAAFEPEEVKQIVRNPEYNNLVMSLASDLKKYNKGKLSEIESVFVNLKNDPEFAKKGVDDKLNNLKDLIQFIKDNI